MAFPLNRGQIAAFGIGLGAVAAAMGLYLFAQRHAHLELKGSILKVRTHASDEVSSVAVIDFRIENPSDYPWEVKTVEVSAEIAEGTVEGIVAADSDATRLFQFYPALGQKFNDSLRMKDQAPARSTLDRMIAVRFEAPEDRIVNRKKLTVRIVETDGAVSELTSVK